MMWWWIDVGDGTGRSRRQARKKKIFPRNFVCGVGGAQRQGEYRGMSQKEEKKKNNIPDQTRPNCGTVT